MSDDSTRPSGRQRGLVIDWGGVLTAAVPEAIKSWAAAEGVDLDLYRMALDEWGFGPDQSGPVAALERGEITAAEFELLLAAEFERRGATVEGAGLLSRMLAGLEVPEPRMFEVVRRAKAAGLVTGLLSNSWGNSYDRHGWDELFDVVVISGEVGMRKPEARIFDHTAALLGLPAHDCVMVDDLAHNVAGAEAAGMTAVLHRDVGTTVNELADLLGLELSDV